jgi:Secretion system C-terminal sorting domain
MKLTLTLLNILLICCTAQAQWPSVSTVNVPAETTTSCSFLSKRRVITDNEGNTFVTWFDKRVNDRYKVFVQKFNNQGAAQWTVNGLGVAGTTTDQVYSEITTDGNGGVIVSWTESRSTSGFDIYAQRINSTGVLQWGANGIAVAVASDEQNFSRITADGSGGAYICWYDLRNAGGNSAKEIFIQKLNSSGASAFAANGIKVPDAKPDAFNWINEPPIWIHRSGSDAVITWEHRVFDAGINIYAQKISSTGTALWGANGLAISNTINTHEQSSSAVDNAGNLFITWKNYSKDSLYIQKVNMAGVVQWTAGGVKLINNFGSDAYSPKVVADNNGGAIVVWNDNRGFSFDIYMQKLNDAGAVQLNADGVVLCDASRDQSAPEIVTDGSGGAIVTWDDKRVNNDSTDVYAQRISSAGVAMWAANGVVVSNAKHKQSYPSIAPLGNSGAVVSWFDNRSAVDPFVFCNDVYVQAIKNDGTLGNPDNTTAIRSVTLTQMNVKTWPNPIQDWLYVQNQGMQQVHFQLLDAGGRVIMNGIVMQAALNQIPVNKLLSGVYLLKITNNKKETSVLMLVKQ